MCLKIATVRLLNSPWRIWSFRIPGTRPFRNSVHPPSYVAKSSRKKMITFSHFVASANIISNEEIGLERFSASPEGSASPCNASSPLYSPIFFHLFFFLVVDGFSNAGNGCNSVLLLHVLLLAERAKQGKKKKRIGITITCRNVLEAKRRATTVATGW